MSVSQIKFSTFFGNLAKVLGNHQNSIVNGILVAATLWGEYSLDAIWQCPCNIGFRKMYALLFAIAPSLLLLFIGTFVNSVTWRICQGYWVSTLHTCRGLWWEMCLVLLKAAVAPLVWIFLLALDGKYYICYKSSKPCSVSTLNANGSKSNSLSEEDIIEYRNLTTDSQIFGWFSLIGVIVLVALVVCYCRCCSKSTFWHDRYREIHQDTEEQMLEEFMKKNAYLQADLNIRRFLAQKISKKDWEQISLPLQRNVDPADIHVSYTQLQEWAHTSGLPQALRLGLNENQQQITEPRKQPPPPPPAKKVKPTSEETIVVL